MPLESDRFLGLMGHFLASSGLEQGQTGELRHIPARHFHSLKKRQRKTRKKEGRLLGRPSVRRDISMTRA
jgi:hypothetical protein